MKDNPLYTAYKKKKELSRSSKKQIKDLDQILNGSGRCDDKANGILYDFHEYNSLISDFFLELYNDKIDFSDEMKDIREILPTFPALWDGDFITDEQKNAITDLNSPIFAYIGSAINTAIAKNHMHNKHQILKESSEGWFILDQTRRLEDLEDHLSHIENSDNFEVTYPKYENGEEMDVADDGEWGPAQWKIRQFVDKVADFEVDLSKKVKIYISDNVDVHEGYTRELIRNNIDDIDWENLRQNKSISDVSNNEHDKKFVKLYEGNLNKFVKIYSNFIDNIGDELGIELDINSELGKVVFDSNDITRHLRNIETHDKFLRNSEPTYISSKLIKNNEFIEDIISLYKSDSKRDVNNFIRDVFMNRKYDADGFSLVDGQISRFDFTKIIPNSNEGLINNQYEKYTNNLSTMLKVVENESRNYRTELKNLFEYKNLLDTYIDKTYNLDQNNIINELFVQSDWIDLKKDGKPDSKACSENLKNRFKEKNYEMQTAVGTQLNKVLGYES